MIKAVLDTNILVSDFWSKNGNAAQVLRMFLDNRILLIYSPDILAEYKIVLSRPAFQFSRVKIGEIINQVRKYGISVDALASDIPFSDESDRKFYDAACMHNAFLITGNLKHYPDSPLIKTPADFLTSTNL